MPMTAAAEYLLLLACMCWLPARASSTSCETAFTQLLSVPGCRNDTGFDASKACSVECKIVSCQVTASCSNASVLSVPGENRTAQTILAEDVEELLQRLQSEHAGCPCIGTSTLTELDAARPNLRGSAHWQLPANVTAMQLMQLQQFWGRRRKGGHHPVGPGGQRGRRRRRGRQSRRRRPEGSTRLPHGGIAQVEFRDGVKITHYKDGRVTMGTNPFQNGTVSSSNGRRRWFSDHRRRWFR